MSDSIGFGPTVEPSKPMSPVVEAQNALHWLVRMAVSFGADAPAREGFGLRWHAERRIALTPELTAGELTAGTRLELQLQTLSLQFHEGGAPSPHRLVLDDKSSAEIEAWLLVEMLHRGFDRDRFSKALPYHAPALMSGDEPKYEAEEHGAELEAIAARLVAAARTLAAAGEALGVPPRADGALTLWPDGFAIGFPTAASDDASSRPVVRLAYVLDADGAGHPAFVASRLADGGEPSGHQSLECADGEADVGAVTALVRRAEATARQ